MKANLFSPISIEPLEDRIAPATLLPGGKIVTFTDQDGDDVTVKFSKPILTNANVGSIFLFDNAFADTGPQFLKTLVLHDLGPEANGVNVTITAHRSVANGGNGQVDMGTIDASNVNLTTGTGAGIDLGKVRVQGSINFLDAGDTDLTTPAVKSVDVFGLGLLVPGVESDIHGSVGKFKVRGSIGGHIVVKSGIAKSTDDVRIGSLLVGGSLLGGEINSGLIEAGAIGRLKIAGDIRGGSGDNSGRILVSNIDRLNISGSILGGGGANSGSVNANNIAVAKISGSIRGGTGNASGSILASGVEAITIGGDLIGNDASFTGLLQINSLGDAVIHGSVLGGNGTSSGRISSNEMGSITVDGSVVGSAGSGSGSFAANTIDTVIIGGDLIGGSGDFSGRIFGGGKLRVIEGSVLGVLPTSGNSSAAAGLYASIFNIDKIVIGGDFINANIAVGVAEGATGSFGDGDDTSIGNPATATIAELIIKGRATSTIAGATFGIEANALGRIQIGGVTYRDGDPGVSFATGFQVDPLRPPLIRVVA
jgi:hypothetical protein